MMCETVLNITDQNSVDNNKLAFEPKKEEFKAFCTMVKGGESDATQFLVTKEKVYEFMFYQAFQEKKKQGGKCKRGECWLKILYEMRVKVIKKRTRSESRYVTGPD